MINGTNIPVKERLICPDFDDRLRTSLDNKWLRYCTRDDGMKANYVNTTSFKKLVQHAVDYLRFQREQESSIANHR